MFTQRLTTPDLHWAAGFIDGEGAFRWSPSNRQLTLIVGQKYTPSLEKLKRLFGGSITFSPKTSAHGLWRWQISSTRAAAVMMTLYGLFSPYRRGQIEYVLSQWKQHKERYLRNYPCYGS